MTHAAYLHPQVAVLRQLLSMFLANVAISRTADINKKTSVCLPISETDRDVVAMEMGPHVAPANKNVAPGAKQLLIINISNYTVL